MNAFLAIAELELRRMAGGRRTLVLAALLAVAALLAAAVRAWMPPLPGRVGGWELVFVVLYAVVYLQTLVILVPLLHATSLIRDDEEEGTLVYLTSRPVPKPVILLAKMAALACFSTAVLLAGSLAFQLAFGLAGDEGLPELGRRWRFMAATGLGALVYGSLFALVGLLSQRGMIFGIVYGFLSEFVLVNVPAIVNRLTVMHWLRSVAMSGEELPAEVEEALGFIQLDPNELAAPATAVPVLLVTAAVCVGLAMLVISRLELRGAREETG